MSKKLTAPQRVEDIRHKASLEDNAITLGIKPRRNDEKDSRSQMGQATKSAKSVDAGRNQILAEVVSEAPDNLADETIGPDQVCDPVKGL